MFAARDPKLGNEALVQLKSEMKPDAFARVKYHQLDITNEESVNKMSEFLKKTYDGLDVLVNNAGIAYKVGIDSFQLEFFVNDCFKKTICNFKFGFC